MRSEYADYLSIITLAITIYCDIVTVVGTMNLFQVTLADHQFISQGLIQHTITPEVDDIAPFYKAKICKLRSPDL